MDNLNLTGITISESNGYGNIQYGDSVDYSTSKVKQIVDAWKNTVLKSGDTATARLITIDDLTDNLGYGESSKQCTGSCWYNKPDDTPSWVYNSNYFYWTMSQAQDSQLLWDVSSDGDLYNSFPYSSSFSVRPVLELNKSADITKLD